MIEIGKGTLYARVPPTRILLRHADDQLRNLLHDPRATRSTAAVHEVPLLRDQSSMPSLQGVRRDDRVKFQQRFAPDRLGLPREKSPFSIGEPKPFASELLLQQTVLGLKEFYDGQLMSVDPARDYHEQKRERRRYRTHDASLSQLPGRIVGHYGVRRPATSLRRTDAMPRCGGP